MASTDMAIAMEIARGMPSGIAIMSKHSDKIRILTVSRRVSFEKRCLSSLKVMWIKLYTKRVQKIIMQNN